MHTRRKQTIDQRLREHIRKLFLIEIRNERSLNWVRAASYLSDRVRAGIMVNMQALINVSKKSIPTSLRSCHTRFWLRDFPPQLRTSRSKPMESMSISFGDPAAQQTFANEYAEFLVEYRHVMEATKAIMLNRVINESIQEEADAVAHLEDDDPVVLAVEDKYKANIASFILARLAIDEFSEMLVLASNNFGLGALKILRSMYEKVVTSAYIAENPEVSRAFVDSTWTHKWSLWKRLRKVSPSAGPGIDPARLKTWKTRLQMLSRGLTSRCAQSANRLSAFTPGPR